MSVTAAAGFRAAGVRAGLRAHGDRPDLALVVNDGPRTTAAGVFTRNQVKAAPVLWSAQVLHERSLRAVVLNSGGANACTGPDGFADTHHTAEKVADVLGCGAIEVAVCSTGLIGERLPIERVLCRGRHARPVSSTPARRPGPTRPPRCSPPTPSTSRPSEARPTARGPSAASPRAPG